jgi:two-component system sensor histidine kinase AtoS
MKSFWTLRLQLVLLIAILLGVMVFGTGLFLSLQAEAALIREKTEKITGITQQMALYYDKAIAKLDTNQTYQSATAKEKRQILEQELAQFTSLLTQTYPNIFYGYFLLEFGAPIAYRPQPGLDEPTSLKISTPIQANGQEIGWTFAYEDKAVIAAQLNQLRLISWGIMGVALLIGVAGAFLIGTNLSRGSTRIKQGLMGMEGDLAVRIPLMTGEMGQIGDAINRLAGAYEEARDYTRYVLETISTGIVSLDEQGTINVFNPAAEKLLGLKAVDCLGRSFVEALRPTTMPQGQRMINLLTEHQKGEQALVISSSHGEPVELGLTVSNLITSSGREAGKVLTIEDLSIKRKLEELLRRSDRLSYLGMFTTGIAHELRNPLASIKGYAQLLLGKELSPAEEKYAQIIVRETDRLDSLLSQLLTFARPSSPQMSTKDMHEILKPMVEMLEEKAREQKVTIRQHLEFTSPVLVDEQKIQQVFWNILLNGLQAMPQGGELEVTLKETPGEVVTSIRDSGPGIPMDQQTQVFDPFFTTKERGSGLGLAISLRIVETLGGRIDFESESGRGTTFWIRLPVAKGEESL